MRYIPGNAQHIGSRQDQQDSFGFSRLEDLPFRAHGGFVAAIADGMGGLKNGKEASQAAIQAFLQSYGKKTADEPIPVALERAVFDANRAVVEQGRLYGAPGDVGSTFVAIALLDQSLYWVSVGDSALYLFRAGRLTLLSRSHTFANELDERVANRSISREEAANHPDREALTSYLGQEPLKEIDLAQKPFPLKVGDQVILSTDGIFKTLGDDGLSRALDRDPQHSCERLVEAALNENHEQQDNLTVLAVAVEPDAGSAATDGRSGTPTVGRGELSQAKEKSGPRFRRNILVACIAIVVCGAIVLAVLSHFRHKAQSAPSATSATDSTIHEGKAPEKTPEPSQSVEKPSQASPQSVGKPSQARPPGGLKF